MAGTFFGCPSGDIDENVKVFGDCIIEAGTTVDGNIMIIDGFLDVRGTVNGNIMQMGDADGNGQGEAVEVGLTGEVNGNITEKDGGHVWIDGVVNGNISESSDGQVRLFNVPDYMGGPIFGIVNGNIAEKGNGGVRVDSELNGNLKEKDAGTVIVGDGILESTIDGNISESGVGFVIITASGLVNGNVRERKAGSVINNGTVNGNIMED